MNLLKILTFTMLSLGMSMGVMIHADTPVPGGGREMIPSDWLAVPRLFNPGNLDGAPVARAEKVETEHPDFDDALRVEVLRAGALFYNGTIAFYSPEAVRKGDTLLVELHFRSVSSANETGMSTATVFVQGPAPSYKKYLVREVSAGPEWKVFHLPLTVGDALPAGDLSLHIGAGGTPQVNTWEIAGIRWINYENRQRLRDLPLSRATYGGREADAPWRTEAAARIEKHRKGDFRIEVVDAEGNPVPGAEVAVDFQRHAYHFGSVISAWWLTGEGEDHVRYREKVLELFNQSGTENDLKWGPWEGDWGSHFNRKRTLEALRWLKDRDFYLRGHVLVWPARMHISERAKRLLPEGNPAGADPALRQLTLDHIRDITTATAELLDEWDVVNEPYNNHDLMDAFGDEVMIDWFKAARRQLPEHGLYLNDFGILSGGGRDIRHHAHFEKTLRFLLDRGAPVTGMGMQGHFGETPTAIGRVYEVLESFHHKFPELDIRVTEFDISTLDEELQADYTRDFLTMIFSHPATVGLQCWGFWEGAHWRPEAAMYTRDWREKPNARVWKELTRETWWNDFSGKTDARGIFADRGFYGEYRVTVRAEGVVKEVPFSLRKDSPSVLRVVLAAEE